MALVVWTYNPRDPSKEGTTDEVPHDEAATLVREGRARWASDDDVDAVKGAALDAALEAAGLPKTGSADEKRARLRDHDTPELA